MPLTTKEALRLFRAGLDTLAIAEQCGVPEAEIYNLLAVRMRWPAWVRTRGKDADWN